MNAYVVIATKGRAPVVSELLTQLLTQTRRAPGVHVVGASHEDVEGLSDHPLGEACELLCTTTRRPGLCVQRNEGVRSVQASRARRGDAAPYFIAFMDDDFRPDRRWLEACCDVFRARPDVVGLTGRILADGVKGPGLSEADAAAYLSGQRPPEQHWASGSSVRDIGSAYGCNMAFRDVAMERCTFDENLPLYGWQEDQDFSSQAMALGRVIYTPDCKGVHLGVKSGRVSGKRFGYSQIANPLYLARKGTMARAKGARFISRHLVANSVRSIASDPRFDYRGRLLGNLLAIRDITLGRCHPTRIADL